MKIKHNNNTYLKVYNNNVITVEIQDDDHNIINIFDLAKLSNDFKSLIVFSDIQDNQFKNELINTLLNNIIEI